MTNENDDAFCVAVLIIILVIGSLPFWLPAPEPEATTTIEEENGVTAFIAVHPYFGKWLDYNNTVSVLVDGRNESGICLDSWFLTSYRYERGTNYTVYINGTLIKTDWIGLVGDFGTWKGASWPYHVGKLVEVCHINMTLLEVNMNG